MALGTTLFHVRVTLCERPLWRLESLGCTSIASGWQGEDNDEGDEGQDADNEDTAFGAGCPTAEDGLAYRVGGEKMVLNHEAAIGHPVKERLAPVPRSV